MILHWIGTAFILYSIAGIMTDIIIGTKMSISSLTGKCALMLILWIILART